MSIPGSRDAPCDETSCTCRYFEIKQLLLLSALNFRELFCHIILVLETAPVLVDTKIQ